MDGLFDSASLSPIELAKRLRILSALSESNTKFEDLKNRIVPSEHMERVAQILKGMEQEDEFAILSKLMGTCESISEVGQSPIVDSGEIAPDFIASFAPDCTVTGTSRSELKNTFQCFIEVKSSKKDPFKISKKDLARRRKFAERYALPLVFAVRFMTLERHAFWVLVDAEQVEQNGEVIKSSDFIGNLNAVLFDDLGLMTHPELHVAHYYDSSAKSPGITHVDHGVLRKTVILLPDAEPRVIDENDHVLVNAFLENFDFNQVEVIRDGFVACVVSHVGTQMRFLSDVMFRINRLAIDKHGQSAFDAGRVVARLDSKSDRPVLLTREMVSHAVRVLNTGGDLIFKMGLGEPEDQKKMLFKITETEGES